MDGLLKLIFMPIIYLIVFVAIIIGGIWGFCYFKYNVNIFTIASDLLKVSTLPNESEIAPNKPTDEDYASIMAKINSALTNPSDEKVITKDEENNYSIDFEKVTKYVNNDLILTGQETCALMNIILSAQEPALQNEAQNIKLKDYDFKLLQIYYDNLESITEDEKTYTKSSFNFVASISLKSVKEKMTNFPFSMIKSKVPDTLFVSSTVDIKMENNTITYTTSSRDIVVNTLKKDSLAPMFSLLNNFVKIGTVDEFNKNLCDVCVNMILGNENSKGFAYSLATQKVTIGSNHYYVSEKFLFEEKTISDNNQVVLNIKKGKLAD